MHKKGYCRVFIFLLKSLHLVWILKIHKQRGKHIIHATYKSLSSKERIRIEKGASMMKANSRTTNMEKMKKKKKGWNPT